MSHLSNIDFNLQIARGLVAGFSFVNRFGRNPDVDAAAPEDLWAQGGTFVEPTAARVHAIVSASVNDTAVGTGARTVYVEGLDANYATVSETVTMNGTTPVNTVNSYVIIHRAFVLTAGSGATNAGDIIGTAAVDATVSFRMMAAKGSTQLAFYMVPAGYSAMLTYYSSGSNGPAGTQVQSELFVKPFGQTFHLQSTLNLDGSASTFAEMRYDRPDTITEKSLVKMRATTDTNNADVSGHFHLLLIEN